MFDMPVFVRWCLLMVPILFFAWILPRFFFSPRSFRIGLIGPPTKPGHGVGSAKSLSRREAEKEKLHQFTTLQELHNRTALSPLRNSFRNREKKEE